MIMPAKAKSTNWEMVRAKKYLRNGVANTITSTDASIDIKPILTDVSGRAMITTTHRLMETSTRIATDMDSSNVVPGEISEIIKEVNVLAAIIAPTNYFDCNSLLGKIPHCIGDIITNLFIQ